MSKKKVTLLDELGITGGGIYCMMPFERLDKNKKALFKIGMAIDFRKRMESFLTDFPLGMYYVAFLENPRTNRDLRNKSIKPLSNIQYYNQIEKYIQQKVIEGKGERITSTAKVHHVNEKKEGQTEWFYTDEKTIFNAFDSANDLYGGKVHKNNLSEINKSAQERMKKPHYTAEIIYPVKFA